MYIYIYIIYIIYRGIFDTYVNTGIWGYLYVLYVDIVYVIGIHSQVCPRDICTHMHILRETHIHVSMYIFTHMYIYNIYL